MSFSRRLFIYRICESRLSILRSVFPIDLIRTSNRDKRTIRNVSSAILSKSTESETKEKTVSAVDKDLTRKGKVSQAMKDYLQRSLEYEKFVTDKVTEYEIGKRHLANMMGENPETFTQDDINRSISYLLPSGLFEGPARPVMKHPQELFPKPMEAAFDETGRPFHSLFYTGYSTFFSVLQSEDGCWRTGAIKGNGEEERSLRCVAIAIKAQELNDLLDKMKTEPTDKKLELGGSKWIKKSRLEEQLSTKLRDEMFEHFVLSLERLADHPLSSKEEKFIMTYREMIRITSYMDNIPELIYTDNGVPYMTATGKRKTCKNCKVTVYGKGTGKFSVNGDDILYFDSHQDREQIMFPLQFTGLLRSVDVKAAVQKGGKSGQAQAIRYAVSMALRSFVAPSMIEKMRIAGLLTLDIRKKERQKPGQRRARAKFTWRKR